MSQFQRLPRLERRLLLRASASNSGVLALDRSAPRVEDKVALSMMRKTHRTLVFVSALTLLAIPLLAQDAASPPSKPKPQTQKPDPANRLTIEIRGGDNNVPVENASVYVKFVQERKLRRDKKYELNVKTNRDGITHVPDSPLGRVLIQVIAEGWKSFGRWYDITDSQQTIQIHLERPPKWY